MTETIIIALSAIIGILALALWISRVDLKATREAWDRASEMAERADERAATIQRDFDTAMTRPYQVFIPNETVEMISHHVIAYLSATEKK